jgi:ribonuclease D
VSHRVVTAQRDFDEVVAALQREPRYALDTEFHRERTYFPKLALLQLAWPGDLVIVDPLAVDVTALTPLFDSDVLAVLHAAQQDLDVLQHAVGMVPRRLYDTQLASGFLGYSTPSLVSLLQLELHVSTPKGDRLTDWLRRPLTDSQMEYAAADVAHLLALHDRVESELARRGRSTWAAEACEELRTRPVSGGQPDEAWRRLKDARTLRPRARAVAQAVAAWRERRAMQQDVPVRQVLTDLAILGIAQRLPRTPTELAQARGVDERHCRGAIAQELLAAVASGAQAQPPELTLSGEELDRGLRPAVTLVSAWVSQVARDQEVDTALLATRADLTAFLRGDADARLLHGWRAEIVGDSLRRLVSGEAGLTFDGSGNLQLIEGRRPG